MKCVLKAKEAVFMRGEQLYVKSGDREGGGNTIGVRSEAVCLSEGESARVSKD